MMIRPSNIYKAAVAVLPSTDIDHKGCDLYVKVTPRSQELMNRFLYLSSVEIVMGENSHNKWYYLPLCYNP